MAKPGNISICGFQSSGVEWVHSIVTELIHNCDLQTACPRSVVSHQHARSSDCQLETFLSDNLVILVVRHPKDTAVASYIQGGQQDRMDFGDYLSHFTQCPATNSMSWFDFHRQWDVAATQCGRERINVVYFNDLVNDLAGETEKLCGFLGTTPSNQCLQQAVTKHSLHDYVTRDEPERKRRKTRHVDERPDAALYEVGLWKQYFTVQQNDDFNQIFSNVFQNKDTRYEIDKLK